MGLFALIASITMSFPSMASDALHTEICTAFAKEFSGNQMEWSYEEDKDISVHYQYDDVFNYCLGMIEPVVITGQGKSYYEFELFVCGGTHQDSTLAYDPITKAVEILGGSGSGEKCPYANP